jgi:hypothetical protein
MATFNPLPDVISAGFQQGGTGQALGTNVPVPYAPAPGTTTSDASIANTDPIAGMQGAQAPQPGFSQDPTVAAQQAEQAHHSLLGKLVKSIMGTDTQFVAQPDGSVHRVDVPQKPGTLFRGMILSGILGAGTQAHSFGEGLARGASTTVDRNLQSQERARQEAVQNEQLKNKKEQLEMQKKKMSDEHAAAAQHLALNNIHTMHLMYTLNTAPKEEFDKVNQATAVADRELQVAGAKSPQMIVNGQDINGQVGSAKAWENALLKDPNLHNATDQNHFRVFLTTQNIPDGFKFDIKKGGWVGPDGTPRDMHDYASVRAYDVPLDSLKQMRDMTGSEANSIIGAKQFDPESKLHTTLGDIIALRSQAAKQALEAAQAKADMARASREDALAKKSIEVAEKNGQTALAQLFKQEIAGIDDTIKEKQKADPNADVSDLQTQRSTANQQFISAVENLNPKVSKALEDAKQKQQDQANLQQQAQDQILKKMQDNLPKPPKKDSLLTNDVAMQYLKAYGNDKIKAREASVRDGWHIPSSDEVGGMVAGGGNPNPTPVSSSRPVEPGSTPF